MRQLILFLCFALVGFGQIVDIPATDTPAVGRGKIDANFEWLNTNKQAADADLTTYAGITPSANTQSFLQSANYAAMRTLLALVVGTNVQAYDADLTTYAGITPSANVQTFLGYADFAAMRTGLGLVIGTNVQAYDADTVKVDAANTYGAYKQDLGAATLEIPNGTSLPGTCVVGEQFMDTDATTGQRHYLCESTNTWALQGDGGGAGSGYATVDDEDTPLTQRTTLNFEGALIACADDTDQTTCTVTGDGTGTDDQTAAEVVVTPVGAVAADDVQEAIQELDTEKAAAATAVTFVSQASAPATCTAGKQIWHDSDDGLVRFCSATDTWSACAQSGSGFTCGDGTAVGATTFNELASNGSNFRTLTVPDALTQDLTLVLPDGNPANSLLVFPAPTTGSSQGAWKGMSGVDSTVLTGTAGTNGDLALWNADGDVVDGPTPPSGAIVGTTDAQELTGKTLTVPVIGAYTVATLPAAGTGNRVAIVTDGASAGDCTTGSGSTRVLCSDTGAAWAALGDGNSGGSAYNQTVDDEDTPLTQRATLNFEGAGVTCADDTDQTTCTISGGSGGALGDLSNVTESTPGNDEIIQYVTDHWENQTLAEAGIAPTANPTFTGTVNASGAEVRIGYGTGPNTDDNGEIAIDSTSAQVRFNSGGIKVLPSIQTQSFVIPAPVAGDDFPLMRAPWGMTLIGVDGVMIGSTNVIGQLQECDTAGVNCADTDADITFDGGLDSDDGTFTDGTIAAGNFIAWKTTSVSGTPTSLTVTISYYVVAD